MTRPRVLLADDHRIVAEGLKRLLEAEFDLVGIVENGNAMVEAAKSWRLDAIVADISMPQLNGIEALEALRKAGIETPVIFLTMHHEVTYARRAIEAGARGFLLKHSAPEELVIAVRSALQGQTFITPALAGELLQAMKGSKASADPVAALSLRQREILRLLADGLSAKQIAQKLDISARTVEAHKYRLMDALGAKSSAELVHFAIKHGVVEL